MLGQAKARHRWFNTVNVRDHQSPECLGSTPARYPIYGTLATWAKQLSLDEDVRTLHAILDEEKRADEKLTGLAKQVINPDAATG
jgi:hypothetical protein